MAEPRPTATVLLSLVIGTTGGALFYYWKLPLPWMLGSMIFVSACAIAGVPVRRYMPLRNIMVVVLGVLVGSFFTAGVLDNLSSWGGALLVMLAYVIVTTSVAVYIFRGLGYMDATTAYFSSTPGGLGIMVIAGTSTPTTLTKYSGIEKTTRKTRVAWAIGISRPSAPASSPAMTMIPRPPGVLEK